ncbi:twin-arginine translocase subunit TatC [Candidatus Saccharibacteria bacterium]|nr:twin-arginine translocase subunit TatC [Candidatus Saccharibacteria bacterium]
MTKRTTRAKTAKPQPAAQPLTFLDHLQELKMRLFWVAVFFVVVSALTYPFFDAIVHVLTAPIGSTPLYYMTPAGGLSFVIKICMYVGVVGTLPVIVYHLYRFVAPVISEPRRRTVVIYTLASVGLAAMGVLFGYFVSLPAALHFLTSINIDQISSLITVDSYIAFVFAYLIAGALLFQLPLVLSIIDSVTPLKPRRLMDFQRHVIVASFVIAAIITPTPDAVNQVILAVPIIVMYQLGIVLVWLRHRSLVAVREGSAQVGAVAVIAAPESHTTVPKTAPTVIPTTPVITKPVMRAIDGVIHGRPTVPLTPQGASVTQIPPPSPVVPKQSIDGLRPVIPMDEQLRRAQQRVALRVARPSVPVRRQLVVPGRMAGMIPTI